jgi:hypothetical protein
MSYSEIGGTEDNLRVKVTTKREKAVAASQIGKTVLDMGESHEAASDFAGHEIRHALANTGSGHMGVRSNEFFIEAYYEPENSDLLSSDEKRKIAEAVGRENMSRKDKKNTK